MNQKLCRESRTPPTSLDPTFYPFVGLSRFFVTLDKDGSDFVFSRDLWIAPICRLHVSHILVDASSAIDYGRYTPF